MKSEELLKRLGELGKPGMNWKCSDSPLGEGLCFHQVENLKFISNAFKTPEEAIRHFLDNNEQKLKPCPFCGSTDLEVYDYAICFVHCTACDADSGRCPSKLKAIFSWNKRHIEDKQ